MSIDVLEGSLVVPVIEGVRDPPFGIAFPTDLVIVANGTRRERSATCATDAAPGSDGTRASGLRVLACRAETFRPFSQGSWSATWIDGELRAPRVGLRTLVLKQPHIERENWAPARPRPRQRGRVPRPRQRGRARQPPRVSLA